MDSRAITHRLEILERWSAAEAARLALHAPYTEVRVCSISQDRARVVHHPEGNYGVSDRLDEIPILEAVSTALRLEGAVLVRMEFSPEWLHCFIMASDLYTPEQKQRTKTAHLDLWPEISWLYEQENPDTLISGIAAIPQNFRIKGGKK